MLSLKTWLITYPFFKIQSLPLYWFLLFILIPYHYALSIPFSVPPFFFFFTANLLDTIICSFYFLSFIQGSILSNVVFIPILKLILFSHPSAACPSNSQGGTSNLLELIKYLPKQTNPRSYHFPLCFSCLFVFPSNMVTSTFILQVIRLNY